MTTLIEVKSVIDETTVREHLIALLAEETPLEQWFKEESRWYNEENEVLMNLLKQKEITHEYYTNARRRTENNYSKQHAEYMRLRDELYQKYIQCPRIRLYTTVNGQITVDIEKTVFCWIERLIPQRNNTADYYRYKPMNMTNAAWDALSPEMKDYYESGARGWSND